MSTSWADSVKKEGPPWFCARTACQILDCNWVGKQPHNDILWAYLEVSSSAQPVELAEKLDFGKYGGARVVPSNSVPQLLVPGYQKVAGKSRVLVVRGVVGPADELEKLRRPSRHDTLAPIDLLSRPVLQMPCKLGLFTDQLADPNLLGAV